MKMKLTAKLFKWSMDESGVWFSINLGKEQRFDVQGFISEVSNKDYAEEYEIVIQPKVKKRSLDANGYVWTLLDKLSAKVGRSSVDIYRELIPDIGDNSYIVPVRDDLIFHWISTWENVPKTKIGWLCRILGPCKRTPGYTNIICYYGSSLYDTKQMARLIDLVVQECVQQEIEVRTPAEIARLKVAWGEKNVEM